MGFAWLAPFHSRNHLPLINSSQVAMHFSSRSAMSKIFPNQYQPLASAYHGTARHAWRTSR
jgi:hypothetical protein